MFEDARELDPSKPFEAGLAAHIRADAMVLWEHEHDVDNGNAHYLLLAAGEDGPRVVGASVWMGGDGATPCARLRMDASLDDICRPMVPDYSEKTGLQAHAVRDNDKQDWSFQQAIQNATGALRCHMNDGTTGRRSFNAYFGRIEIDGVKSFVCGHSISDETRTAFDNGIAFTIPIADFKKEMIALYEGDAPAPGRTM